MSETILVTGANSFIGTWIVKTLLEKGYNVRGTVRSQAKESHVLAGISKDYHDRISFVHVADIATDSFEDAVQNVQGIIHVASPFHFKITDPEKDLLIPAINGTVGILQAAHKYNQNNEKKIRKVVITSSFASVIDVSKGLRPGYSYTEHDWSPITYEQGVAAKNEPMTAYRASKICAERAAWDFMKKENPSFTIAVLCEPFVFGPRVNGFTSIDDVNTSNALIRSFIRSGKDAPIPELRVPFQVDVRDVAYAHVAALEQSNSKNERYLIAGDTWSYQKVADLIHESTIIPDTIKNTTPIGNKGQQLDDHYQIDSEKAQRELGIKYTPLKKTIEDLVLQFSDLQAKLEQP